MTNPWSVLGLRKGSGAEQIWHGYAKSLRQLSDHTRKRRARDAFEALELGLWGRFADSVERDHLEAVETKRSAYGGPFARELAELDYLLSGQIDDLKVRDQIEALFDDAAMERAEIYLRVQPALAELLESHLPRSEPFIAVAVDRFRHLTDQAREEPVVARLLDRADELELLNALESGGSEHSNGWRALSKPASWLPRWIWARSERRQQVATLYAYAGWSNPRLRRRIDAGEWAWWSEELSRERTSFAMLLGWMLAAVLIGAAAMQYQAPTLLAVAAGTAAFAFLLVDNILAGILARRRVPCRLDGPSVVAFSLAALLLPAFTRLLPPDLPATLLVAGLALAIAWGLRISTGLPGGVRSSAWLDSAGLPALVILFFGLSLPIPWQRYVMLASYVWLLHGVFPQLRRAMAMALDRFASLPWGYLFAGAGALLAVAAVFAVELKINRESTRMALLITAYALFSLSVYFGRPFPQFFALLACVSVGGYLVVYCQGGGEYHPGPRPSAGETLLAAERGDVIDWAPFPANGEEVLERIKRNNPEAYARLAPLLRNASCDRGRDGDRECEAYPIDAAIYAEVGRLVDTMSNDHMAEWNRLEARAREEQFKSGSGACSALAPQFSKLSPIDIRRDHAALVLDIIGSGPRPLSERPSVPLPDLPTFERAMEDSRRQVAELEGGPTDPRLRQACINQLVRARGILHFDTDVAARISRGGYPQ